MSTNANVESGYFYQDQELKINNEEIRSVLVRHWTSLDRARLHTFHLWLFVYALAQIFLFHYLCHRVISFFCIKIINFN